ncbi:histidine ammonia-lyase [Candidatus Micrarchaeota archaeon]|nr:histidine ammonia-lyase [Candidatus Micrarchaeota archaeon]
MGLKPLVLDGPDLSIEDVVQVAREYRLVKISKQAEKKIQESAALVQSFVEDEKLVYGITTGVGDLARVSISLEELELLQQNLLESHAVGVGDFFETEIVRAALLLRINSLVQGFSGVRLSTLNVLVHLLNKQVHSLVPEKGSVGASGDLAPLAHLMLPLTGKGMVELNGVHLSAVQALKQVCLEPIKLAPKEGLALINGTQFMSAIACLGVFDGIGLIKNAEIASALSFEALHGQTSSFEAELHNVRPHPGQVYCARNIRRLIKHSRIVDTPNEHIQDPYSLRCIPQVVGPVRDTLLFCKKIVETELNSVTDNPLIFSEEKKVLSGGNFHGEYLAFALDFLNIAISELASIAERRIARLVDSKLSGLPSFLVSKAGVNSGFMIVQYTAASLVSQNKGLCFPASVDSIPTSANQEDHVSMGSISANKFREILFNVQNVIGIEFLCASQALNFVSNSPGVGTKIAWETVREKIPFIKKDCELYPLIHESFSLVKSNAIVSAVEQKIGAL